MEQITPISSEKITPHMGKLVCVVLNDETRFYGYLGGIQEGKLILHEEPRTADEKESTLATKNRRNRARVKFSKNTQKAKATALTPGGLGYGHGFGGFWIDIALISLLLLVPLFFI